MFQIVTFTIIFKKQNETESQRAVIKSINEFYQKIKELIPSFHKYFQNREEGTFPISFY